VAVDDQVALSLSNHLADKRHRVALHSEAAEGDVSPVVDEFFHGLL